MIRSIVVGSGGLPGWQSLKANEARHLATVARDPVVQRSTAYYQEKIGQVTNAADLVKDYRLLQVALGAFGLEDDARNKAFIEKVLESDPSDSLSLVNRLSDKRYLRLAAAFGFGELQADQKLSPEHITESYVQRIFEKRVGEGDENLRLALNARRDMKQFLERDSSNNTMWFEVIGNPPLRKVFDGAFGFGSAYGKLSIDRQLEEYKNASERFLGTSDIRTLATDAEIDNLVRHYLAKAQIVESRAQNRYSAALTLLSGR